jgi:prepilin-type N-terminal cleavage/methylation domain-containing protein
MPKGQMVMLHKLGLIAQIQKGFTLIEIMVDLVITSVISVGLSTTIMQMMTVGSSSQNRTEAIKQVENALHYINRDAEMAFPSLIDANISSNYFSVTALLSSSSIGATTLVTSNATGFVARGTLVVDTSSTAETLAFTARTGNNLTVSAATKAHSSGSPVSNALTLKWKENSDTVKHQVTYYLVTINNIKYLQRSETIDAGTPTILRVASNIDPTFSYYTFDGKTLAVELTARVTGVRSATETRKLEVLFRPTYRTVTW